LTEIMPLARRPLWLAGIRKLHHATRTFAAHTVCCNLDIVCITHQVREQPSKEGKSGNPSVFVVVALPKRWPPAMQAACYLSPPRRMIDRRPNLERTAVPGHHGGVTEPQQLFGRSWIGIRRQPHELDGAMGPAEPG
jgi:hypothetical protein